MSNVHTEHFGFPEYEALVLETGAQHVEDPIWPSEPVSQSVDDVNAHPHFTGHHGHEGVDTNHGVTDLLQRVKEEVDEWVGREDEKSQWPKHPVQPMAIETYQEGSHAWRGVTYNVDRPMKIVSENPTRRRVVITNWGPGFLYLAADSQAGVSNPQINAVQMPVAIPGNINSREFFTTAEIWAFPGTPGNAQVVDVQDEFGKPQ